MCGLTYFLFYFPKNETVILVDIQEYLLLFLILLNLLCLKAIYLIRLSAVGSRVHRDLDERLDFIFPLGRELASVDI